MMNRDEIKTFLPHREPMLLVDDVDLQGDKGIAHYHVRGDEFFLQGHYPGYPVVPGVILCEIMAQSSCVLLKEDLVGKTPFYSGIDEARFKRQVRPGDTIEITSQITYRRATTYIVETKCSVEGQLCAKGKLMFTLVPKKTE